MEECQTIFEELCTYLTNTPLLTRPVEFEILYPYLTISLVMVSSILIWEDEGVQMPAYYTSRLLKDAETRYPRMEKVTYTLLISSRWLPPYFQAHSIIILTDQPLRLILQKLDTFGRITKWMMELGEFDMHATYDYLSKHRH